MDFMIFLVFAKRERAAALCAANAEIQARGDEERGGGVGGLGSKSVGGAGMAGGEAISTGVRAIMLVGGNVAVIALPKNAMSSSPHRFSTVSRPWRRSPSSPTLHFEQAQSCSSAAQWHT
jgi:hypothetical protein